jgi:hypothetical protein
MDTTAVRSLLTLAGDGDTTWQRLSKKVLACRDHALIGCVEKFPRSRRLDHGHLSEPATVEV